MIEIDLRGTCLIQNEDKEVELSNLEKILSFRDRYNECSKNYTVLNVKVIEGEGYCYHMDTVMANRKRRIIEKENNLTNKYTILETFKVYDSYNTP